jgi:hypothetical protein
VNCRFSNFSQSRQPAISPSVRLSLHTVATTEPWIVAAAALTSANVTGKPLVSAAWAGPADGVFLGARDI